jgi:hypothetical protein
MQQKWNRTGRDLGEINSSSLLSYEYHCNGILRTFMVNKIQAGPELIGAVVAIHTVQLDRCFVSNQLECCEWDTKGQGVS